MFQSLTFIEDLESCPDRFEDLDDLEKSLHYMTKEDKEEIKEVYLKQLNTIQDEEQRI